MLLTVDYKHQSRHPQGFVTEEQAEGLAIELVNELYKINKHSSRPILFRNKNEFRIYLRTGTTNSKLELVTDGKDNTSNLYVRLSGQGSFDYNGLFDIANITHGEVPD
jgi:hypothetical protein